MSSIRIYSSFKNGQYGIGYPGGELLFVADIVNGEHVKMKNDYWYTHVEFILRSGQWYI